MTIELTPSFVLTDEHPACSYGQPVLVDRSTQEAYGPNDILKTYASWSYGLASEHVRRMARTGEYEYEWSDDDRAFVAKFTDPAQAPIPSPQAYESTENRHA